MKILFMSLGIYGSVGGMQRFNRRVIRCLAELHPLISKFHVIALWDSASQGSTTNLGNAFTPCSSNKLLALTAFVRAVWKMQPDIILFDHVLLSPLATMARIISPRSRRVLFVYGNEVWGAPAGVKISSLDRWAVRHFIDKVISISVFTKENMKRAFALTDEIFSILPCAVDVDLSCVPPEPVAASSGSAYRLLTVARLGYDDRYKGLDNVIRSLPMVLSVFSGVRYDIVGDGILKQEFQRLVDQLGVAEHVHFLGRLDEKQLETAYQTCHLFVMPSKQEGFGIVFLEAWKHGLPVIAGNQDASPEVVTHGENGLIVNPDSVEEIGQAIVSLVKDQKQAIQMGRKGYETVLEHYTHEHFRNNLRQILESLACPGEFQTG